MDADAVADEGGRVEGRDDFFAQLLFEPGAEGRGIRVRHIRPFHELQEAQVAHGVEEVRDGEVLLKALAAPFGQQAERNARGVGGDPGAVLEMAFEPRVEILLDLQILFDDLHDPVAVLEAVEMVAQVAGTNFFQEPRVHHQRRLGLLQPLDGARRELVGVRVVNDDIEQLDLAPCRRHMGRDTRPHDA